MSEHHPHPHAVQSGPRRQPGDPLKLLAIDLDGTLLDSHGTVPPANAHALRRAQAAGVTVVLCTGRALVECQHVAEEIGLDGPMVVSGGALVACPRTGATLERFTLDHALAAEITAYLHSHGRPALVLKDHGATGYDYLVLPPPGRDARASLDAASAWWFEVLRVRVRYGSDHRDDEHPHDTIRVGAYSANDEIDGLATALRERYAHRSALQHFRGATLPASARERGIESVHIVELFHARADKWLAIERLAARLEISPAHIAAVGDQLNDLTMITQAGVGIAMANAAPAVLAAAARRTTGHDDAGVALAVDQLLAGAW